MKPMSGFETAKQVLKISPQSKIIGVSIYNMPAYAKKMLQLGAMGYITKNSSRDEMMKAIVEVNLGHTYICDEVKNFLLKQKLIDDSSEPGMNVLSRRELEVVTLIRDGLSSKEIAGKSIFQLKQ